MSERASIPTKRGLWGRVLNSLRMLKTLTAMQLKEKMDLSYLRSFRKTLFKAIWTVIEFVLITLILKFAMDYIKIAGIFSPTGDIPVSVITVVFTVMMLVSIVASTVGLVQALYFSRDNTVLLTLPASPNTVFVSKLAVYYVYEFRKNFLFTIPLFIAYGISKGLTLWYYPWLLILFVFISALPVIVAALLSIPSMYVYQWIRKRKILQYSLYVIGGAGLILLAIWLISKMPEDLNILENWGESYYQIQKFLSVFTQKIFLPFHKFTEIIVGKQEGLTVTTFTAMTPLHFIMLLAITAGLFALCVLFSKPLFYKMASKPFEYIKKNNIKEKRNYKTASFLSSLKKEIIIGIRSNKLITLAMITVVAMPLVLTLVNKLYAAMDTSVFGKSLVVTFSMAIILLFMLVTNIDIASAYSRDGSTAYLNKVQPQRYSVLLISKLICNLVIGLAGIVVTMLALRSVLPLSGADTVPFGATAYFAYVAHMFWSAEMDIMNPQYEQYATFNEQANNPNENKSAIIALVITVLFAVMVLFFGRETLDSPWVKIMLIAIVLAAVKIGTFFMKIAAFYKEKQ